MHARNLPGICILLGAIAISSCTSTELDTKGEIYLDLPETKFNYVSFPDAPDSLNAKATLGRVLFYDRQLSLNNTVACASCHKQEFAFADNQKFSRGFESRLTTRNSMPLQNISSGSMFFFTNDLAFFPGGGATHLFWDGRETDIEKLILQLVGNHIEMGITDINDLTAKLSSLPYYESLFTDAYGSKQITSNKISRAVASFVTSISSFNTKFDRYNQSRFGATGTNEILSPLEVEGMMLFNNKYDCNACHQVQNPVGYLFAGTFANAGLDLTYADNGLANVTKNSDDIGKFKIPSLRNVSYTAPYMHDGRFETLDDVMEHYSEGIANNPNLDARLADPDGNARSMNISQYERDAIIAFLRTLSDESMLTDPKFSNPFKVK